MHGSGTENTHTEYAGGPDTPPSAGDSPRSKTLPNGAPSRRPTRMTIPVPTLNRDLFGGVNRVIDPLNITDLEKKHTPFLDVPEKVRRGQPFPVNIEVGKLLGHPNRSDHFIDVIDLYADETFLARVDLTAISTQPKVTLSISLDGPVGELRAYGRCIMHGVWLGSAPVTVID